MAEKTDQGGRGMTLKNMSILVHTKTPMHVDETKGSSGIQSGEFQVFKQL